MEPIWIVALLGVGAVCFMLLIICAIVHELDDPKDWDGY